MATSVFTGTLVGVDAVPVEVEVDHVRRLPGMVIVGLASGAVRESAERVRSALLATGHEFPRKKVVVNLAPANLRKSGTTFDLPIAIGILAEAGDIPSTLLPETVFAGELSLQGALRRAKGALPLTLMARAMGAKRIVLPETDLAEAFSVPNIDVLGASSLRAVVEWLRGTRTLVDTVQPQSTPVKTPGDLSEVRGQPLARRALEIAAAGGHNLLLVGPPGCGKTMLASRLPSIMPPPSFDEAVDVTRIHSAAGLIEPGHGLLMARPFRAPHHTITAAGMAGSASLTPGEIGLAHCGVLFLDEVAEFRRSVLELLRGPLEDRKLRLVRAAGTATFPADLCLVAAANPCPCGFARHATRPCTCTPSQVERYRARLSGPLIDRIDLQVGVQPVPPEELEAEGRGESSAAVRARVVAAREIQQKRQRSTGAMHNAQLAGDAIRRAANPTQQAVRTLREILQRHGLSARAWARILKVARTIADLENVDQVDTPHVLEATSFRVTNPTSGR